MVFGRALQVSSVGLQATHHLHEVDVVRRSVSSSPAVARDPPRVSDYWGGGAHGTDQGRGKEGEA